MRQHILRPLIPALCALALLVTPAALFAQDRHDDRDDQKPAPRPEMHHDDARPDPVAQYRHDHPHAAARCHDGFFTNTSDRSRACSKHGGIDVWLSL
jgi:hypothetical protein